MSHVVQLGELLSLGRQTSSTGLLAWLEAEHEDFARELQDEANVRGETLAQFLRISVSDFLAEADEESWAGLLSAVRDAPDPGAACVAYVSTFRMRRESAS